MQKSDINYSSSDDSLRYGSDSEGENELTSGFTGGSSSAGGEFIHGGHRTVTGGGVESHNDEGSSEGRDEQHSGEEETLELTPSVPDDAVTSSQAPTEDLGLTETSERQAEADTTESGDDGDDEGDESELGSSFRPTSGLISAYGQDSHELGYDTNDTDEMYIPQSAEELDDVMTFLGGNQDINTPLQRELENFDRLNRKYLSQIPQTERSSQHYLDMSAQSDREREAIPDEFLRQQRLYIAEHGIPKRIYRPGITKPKTEVADIAETSFSDKEPLLGKRHRGNYRATDDSPDENVLFQRPKTKRVGGKEYIQLGEKKKPKTSAKPKITSAPNTGGRTWSGSLAAGANAAAPAVAGFVTHLINTAIDPNERYDFNKYAGHYRKLGPNKYVFRINYRDVSGVFNEEQFRHWKTIIGNTDRQFRFLKDTGRSVDLPEFRQFMGQPEPVQQQQQPAGHSVPQITQADRDRNPGKVAPARPFTWMPAGTASHA